jgi:hypothetical protein
MTSHGTRSRGISCDLRVSASDVTHPSPGSLLRNGSVNTPSMQQCERARLHVCTIEGFIRESGMSKKSVLRSEFVESVLGESFTKKISQSARSVNM